MNSDWWISSATQFSFDHYVSIEARKQRDGSFLWCVCKVGSTLNSDGEWEYEPLPSSRDDDYISRTRMRSKEDALERLRRFFPLLAPQEDAR